ITDSESQNSLESSDRSRISDYTPMTRARMKQSSGWRPVATGGFAGLVTVLALFYTLRQLPEGVPANVQASPRLSLSPDLIPPPRPSPVSIGSHRPPVRAPEGPAMRIEPGELVHAGWERDDNGIGMKFCWCPPGVFHMGALPDHLARHASANPVSVTIGR